MSVRRVLGLLLAGYGSPQWDGKNELACVCHFSTKSSVDLSILIGDIDHLVCLIVLKVKAILTSIKYKVVRDERYLPMMQGTQRNNLI